MYLHHKKDKSIEVVDGESECEESIEDEDNFFSVEQHPIAVATKDSEIASQATYKLSTKESDTVKVDNNIKDDGKISEDEFEDVPDSYTFPSFFIYCMGSLF